MFRIDPVSRVITMNRGDSVWFPIYINKIGNMWAPIKDELTEHDTIYFGVMEPNRTFEQAVIKQVYSIYSETDEDGDIIVKLEPKDTVRLKPGKYFYSIKRRRLDPETLATEIVDTIIPDTLFYIN